MNTINKMLLAGLFSLSMLTAMAQGPQPCGHQQPDAVAGATAAPRHDAMPDGALNPHGDMHHPMMQPMEFQSVRTCYLPQMRTFLTIDSIDCAVDMLRENPETGELERVGRFVTEDNLRKRHDLKNIVRPKSVGVVGHRVVVVASAANDTSYVAVLRMCPGHEMELISKRAFNCRSEAFQATHEELVITGHNAVGYDINIIPLEEGGIDAIGEAPVKTMHYHKPKQSEQIKASDPVGIGLTAVAVSVVFLALVCIALIIQGTSKLVGDVENKDKKDKKAKGGAAIAASAMAADNEAEIYAAIAAAIHLYNEELHDEENTVITIQKVEREWTPWNAKYYNMNHYFINRK